MAPYFQMFQGDIIQPPTITSHTSTAIVTPAAHVGMPSCDWSTMAIELGCVNGVVLKRLFAGGRPVP